MATHSSILAQRIPWAKEPGRLQFIGLQRVRHDLATEQQQEGLVWVQNGCIFIRGDLDTTGLQLAAASRYYFENYWCP